MVRRLWRPVALPPPIPRLPPGAGNQADKLEEYVLKLAKKGYLYVLGQPNKHAPTITANRDGGKSAMPVDLTHLARRLLPWGDVS